MNITKQVSFCCIVTTFLVSISIILLTIKMMPNTASQRRTVEAGFHSNFTQLYGVNWKAIRLIFPLRAMQQIYAFNTTTGISVLTKGVCHHTN